MHDIMLVNLSGLPGHFMPIDMNIEHLIGYLKVCDCRASNIILIHVLLGNILC